MRIQPSVTQKAKGWWGMMEGRVRMKNEKYQAIFYFDDLSVEKVCHGEKQTDTSWFVTKWNRKKGINCSEMRWTEWANEQKKKNNQMNEFVLVLLVWNWKIEQDYSHQGVRFEVVQQGDWPSQHKRWNADQIIKYNL